MPEGHAARPFITSDLRPSAEARADPPPPLDPGTSTEELGQRARELLGEAWRDRPGLGDGAFTPHMWQTVFYRSPDVNSTVLDREAVLLNLENGVYYSLNRVGTVVWELLTGDRTLEEILTALRARFDVPEDVARDDLVALVTRLRQERLLDERR